MNEKQLAKKFIHQLKQDCVKQNVPFMFFFIESGATHIGIPDCYIVFRNKAVWLEFKRANGDLRPYQRFSLKRLNDLGQLAFLVRFTTEGPVLESNDRVIVANFMYKYKNLVEVFDDATGGNDDARTNP